MTSGTPQDQVIQVEVGGTKNDSDIHTSNIE